MKRKADDRRVVEHQLRQLLRFGKIDQRKIEEGSGYYDDQGEPRRCYQRSHHHYKSLGDQG